MAGFGVAHLPPASVTQLLPTGPCSHNDAVRGTCGCEQFWDSNSVDLHHGSRESRSSSERSTTCVCGHHACFHKASVTSSAARAMARCDGRCGLDPASQCPMHRLRARYATSPAPQAVGQQQSSRYRSTRATSNGQPPRDQTSLASASRHGSTAGDHRSQLSFSGLPPVPSMCLKSVDRPPVADTLAGNGINESRQSMAGLGLSCTNTGAAGTFPERQQSVTSTIPDDVMASRQSLVSLGEAQRPISQAQSVTGTAINATTTDSGPLTAILEFNRNLHLDVSGDTIPNTFNPDEIIQSATEVATPSNNNTPNLAVADHAVHDGKKLLEGLLRATSKTSLAGATTNISAVDTTATPLPQLWLSGSSDIPSDQLDHLLKSPQELKKLVAYLPSLYNLLSSIPNVANTLRDLGDRLALLETNNSFNYVHPEDLEQHLDMYDVRLTDVENRLEEHDRMHHAMETDHGSLSAGQRLVKTVTESFSSNQSLQSTTSSALILAAIDRKDMASEIGSIKDRLDVLEAAALPTSLEPWDVEVVLLPWGPELRGIWYRPDEFMQDVSKAVTQDSEEWTQARSSIMGVSRSFPGPLRITDLSPRRGSDGAVRGMDQASAVESGWSSEAISDWVAGSPDDFLSPKACGCRNEAYRRLKSRGFVKEVKIKSSNAKDIQATLSQAFHALQDHWHGTQESHRSDTEPHLGLQASFIPLRKVAHDSRLHFLVPSEMTTSALWSAEFLASGIMMRITGGKKRLYVTQPQAYTQSAGVADACWTWRKLRLLPRQSSDPDSQMGGNDEGCRPQVAEADAKEQCWRYYEALDGPAVDVTASFGSHRSVEVPIPPIIPDRRSMTPVATTRQLFVPPVSPVSELPRQRPEFSRHRTLSAGDLGAAASGLSKRRLDRSTVKQCSVPQSLSRAPSISMTRLKRRRVGGSTSPHQDTAPHEAQPTIWANTPRRSREPPSPFVFTGPQAYRTNSDLASRPSQRSVALVSKGTPFAYATPHSGAFIAGAGIAGGDTEADDDDYQDDDGEQSWRGLTTGEDDDHSEAESDAKGGAELEPASFSGDERSDFSSGDEMEDDESDAYDGSKEEEGYQTKRRNDEDIYDRLLGVLEDD